MSVIWHDLECGSYVEDLPLWRRLAEEHGSPVLDLGAGTGRVALELARAGCEVTALDTDPGLISELRRRAEGLAVETVVADARSFDLARRYPLCLVPMQTIQLMGGSDGRRSCLTSIKRHLAPGGLAALALSDELECYEVGDSMYGPLPDICERDGVVYCSQPTAVREQPDGFVLERRRETVTEDGRRFVEQDLIQLDRLTPEQLELEARSCGLRPVGRAEIAPTHDYSGSQVVMLSA